MACWSKTAVRCRAGLVYFHSHTISTFSCDFVYPRFIHFAIRGQSANIGNDNGVDFLLIPINCEQRVERDLSSILLVHRLDDNLSRPHCWFFKPQTKPVQFRCFGHVGRYIVLPCNRQVQDGMR